MAAPPSGASLALLDKLVAALNAKGLVSETEIAEREAIAQAAAVRARLREAEAALEELGGDA